MKNLFSILLVLITIIGSCEQPTEPPDEDQPYFKPNEYGGTALAGTEHLYEFQLSPDGSKIALIRKRTPDDITEPRNQLWIVDAVGTNPSLISYDVGTVDWSTDGKKLAVTHVPGAPHTYVFTINLEEMEAKQWTGAEDMFFSEQVEGNPRWFSDDKKLLISVWGKAYQQTYERGIYTLDTSTQEIEGPLVPIASRAFLGKNGDFFTSDKYVDQENPQNGNYIRYDFDSKVWTWITTFTNDSLGRWVKLPRPNPKGPEIVYARFVENAWQLFIMDENGDNERQFTILGGNEISWSKDGTKVYFNRDTHKAPGARYIPFYYELETGVISPLWPDLPDSVPEFPPVNTQNPIDLRNILKQ